MKRLIKKKTFPVLIIAGALLLFLSDFSFKSSSAERERDFLPGNINPILFSASQSHERVVYSCRLEDEEIPAVQISEGTDVDGRVIATIARVSAETGIEVIIPGIAATWDYKSISARSADAVIDVAFAPNAGQDGYDWILTLADKDAFFVRRVRDCTEVSDE